MDKISPSAGFFLHGCSSPSASPGLFSALMQLGTARAEKEVTKRAALLHDAAYCGWAVDVHEAPGMDPRLRGDAERRRQAGKPEAGTGGAGLQT
jgi:hypothetical protein